MIAATGLEHVLAAPHVCLSRMDELRAWARTWRGMTDTTRTVFTINARRALAYAREMVELEIEEP